MFDVSEQGQDDLCFPPRRGGARNLFVRSPVTALIVLLAVAFLLLRVVPLLV